MTRSGSGSFQLLTGVERRTRLLELGCSTALVDALDRPSACWVDGGERLADLLDIPYIRDHWMPSGTIVPVCQLDDASVYFLLFVIDGDGVAKLVLCHDEFVEPVKGGIHGFLTDRLQYAWEVAGVPSDALVRWAQDVGYPAAADLFERLARR